MDDKTVKTLGDTLKTLDADSLEAVRALVGTETEGRRPKVQLEDIKSGMSEETFNAAFYEIQRVLKGGA